MISAHRFQIFMAAHGLTSASLASDLGVSTATIDRYRNGHSPVSAPVQKLMQKTWPLWWDFLTEQSNQIPTLPGDRVHVVRDVISKEQP